MMPLPAIAVLAAITYALRIAGPLLADRVTVPAAAQRLFTSAAAVLLVALAATSALTTGHDFAGWARPAGVAAAGLLAARRAPFPVVVVVAASVTAPAPPRRNPVIRTGPWFLRTSAPGVRGLGSQVWLGRRGRTFGMNKDLSP